MFGTKTIYLLYFCDIWDDPTVFAATATHEEAYATLIEYVNAEQHNEDRADFYGIATCPLVSDWQQLDRDDPERYVVYTTMFDFSEMNKSNQGTYLREEFGDDFFDV